MRGRRNKSLLDKTKGQAEGYVDAVRPQLESALDTATEFVQKTALPKLAEAREKAAPALAEARDRAVPVLQEARDKAAPVIATGAAVVAERASAAKEAANARVARSKGEQPKQRSKVKTLLVLAGVAGAVAVIARRLQGGKSSDNWQSSYVPSPSTGTGTDTGGTDTGGTAEADSPISTTPTAGGSTGTPGTMGTPGGPELAEDTGGASPDEALADAVEEPRPATTPDEPAEVVELDDKPRP